MFEVCFGVKYHIYYYEDLRKIEYLLEDVKRRGHQVVIGSNIIFNTAKRLGLNVYYYFSQKSVEDGIRNAEQIIQNLARENQYIKEISTILENATCGVIYFDAGCADFELCQSYCTGDAPIQARGFFGCQSETRFPSVYWISCWTAIYQKVRYSSLCAVLK